MRAGGRGAPAFAAGLAALVALALAYPAPETAEAQTCGAAPPPPDNLYNYTGSPQPFRVPSYASQLRIYADGGHGGQFDRTAAGGVGGGIEAIVPVTPGECLLIYIGGFGTGDGGFGWGEGGDGLGIAGGEGYDGADGGGSTALVRPPSDVLLVAGGGGGGGGDGFNPSGSNYGGGIGGNGGNPAASGKDGDHATGGTGGSVIPGRNGTDGNSPTGTQCQYNEAVDLAIGGGGGGGGGAVYAGNAGCQGHNGYGFGESSGGGGGAGGGRSDVLAAGGKLLQYYQSPHYCPYGNNLDCNGSMDIFQGNPPKTAAAAAARDHTDLFPEIPTVRVRSLELKRLLRSGLPVGVSPVAPDSVANRIANRPRVRLRLLHRCRGKWEVFEKGSVRPSTKRAKRVRLELEGEETSRVRKCWHKPRHRYVRLKLVAEFRGHTSREHYHLYGQHKRRR